MRLPRVITLPAGWAVLLGSILYGWGAAPSPAAASLPEADWSTPYEVVDDSYVFSPAMALSDDGKQILTAWANADDLRSRAGSASGTSSTWGSIQTVDGNSPGNVELAMSGDGRTAIVAWRANSNSAMYALGTVAATSVAWSSPVSLGCNCLVKAALSRDGTRATLLYLDTQAGAIRSKSGTVSGSSVTWSAEATLSASFSGVDNPLLGMSADGTQLLAVFSADSSGFQVKFKAVAGTVTGSPPTVTWGGVSSVTDGRRSYSPNLAFSRDGTTAILAWWDIYTYPDTRVASRTAAVSGTQVTWSNSIDEHTAAGTAMVPEVGLSADGSQALIAWQREPYGQDTKAVITRYAANAGSASAWQAPVTIPGSEGSGTSGGVALAPDGSAAFVLWASTEGNVVTPQVSATSLDNGLDWAPASPLSGMLSPGSAANPAIEASNDASTVAATWNWTKQSSSAIYVNTGSLRTTPGPAPSPTPPTPSEPPTAVTGTPGDRSVVVSWKAPSATGTFPVTNYLVRSLPGDRTCVTAGLTCTVTGLTNGTSYAFVVLALTGAGWSASSEPSAPVKPQSAPPLRIVIAGSREGKRIVVQGGTSGLGAGAIVAPWVKLSGQTSYSEGSARVLVSREGTFTWSRSTGRQAFVYFTSMSGSTRSNQIAIPGS